MNNSDALKKMLFEFFAAKIAIYVKTLELQGIPADSQERIVNYATSFGELSKQISYHYLMDAGHCVGIRFEAEDEILSVHFRLKANLDCEGFNIKLGKGFGVESFIYGLLISVFAQKCSGGTGQLYELATLLSAVDVNFSVIKDIFESELETSKLIVQNQDYYSSSAEMYKYAWYSDLVLLGFRETTEKLDSLYNSYISTAYNFLSRLTGTKRAKYWNHLEKIWVTV